MAALQSIAGVSRTANDVGRAWRSTVADMLEAAWGDDARVSDNLMRAGATGTLNDIARAWVLECFAHPLAEVVEAAFHVAALLERR